MARGSITLIVVCRRHWSGVGWYSIRRLGVCNIRIWTCAMLSGGAAYGRRHDGPYAPVMSRSSYSLHLLENVHRATISRAAIRTMPTSAALLDIIEAPPVADEIVGRELSGESVQFLASALAESPSADDH